MYTPYLLRIMNYHSAVHGVRPAFVLSSYAPTNTTRVAVLMHTNSHPFGGVSVCGVDSGRVTDVGRVRVARRVAEAA